MLIAVFPGLPYGYYSFLRVIVFVSGIVLASKSYRTGNSVGLVVYGAYAILFNPIYPIFLDRNTWMIFDFMGVYIFVLGAKREEDE